MKLSCSYLSSDDKEKTIKELNESKTDYIHLDIMDGIFVKEETLDFNTLRNYFYENKKKLDIHLMVKNVKLYTDLYSLLNPEFITFHIEVGNTLELINYIKNKNIKVGIAIKPNTNVEVLKPYIDKIDLVLIMSVEPGYGGQQFIEKTIEKITKIRNMKKDIIISIDGGINKDNINKIKEKEVDMCVIGSYITKSNIKEKIIELKSLQ